MKIHLKSNFGEGGGLADKLSSYLGGGMVMVVILLTTTVALTLQMKIFVICSLRFPNFYLKYHEFLM